VLAEPVAPAGPPAPGSGFVETDQAVKALMRRGVADYRKGHLEAARSAFARAFALKRHAAIAATLAEVETKLERYAPAAAHWAFYLDHLPPEREGERKEVESALAACRRRLGTIRVEVDAPTARVTLDGEPIAPSALDALWVAPGEHTLAAESEQGAYRIVLSVAAGESKTAVLHTVTPASTSPGAPVAPAAAARPATPPAATSTPASDSERRRHETTASSARTVVVISGAGATLAAAIAGTTFTVLSSRAARSADAIARQLDQSAAEHMLPPDGICALATPPIGCNELTQKQADRERNKKAALGSFVAAGGLAALTLGAYLLWPASKDVNAAAKQQRWAFAPWFGPTGAGIQVSLSHDLIGL
jgi:hypothetical protein